MYDRLYHIFCLIICDVNPLLLYFDMLRFNGLSSLVGFGLY